MDQMKDESITDFAERLYDAYKRSHPWIRPNWKDLHEEFREVWYQVAVEARK
jgi:hypothetical protein